MKSSSLTPQIPSRPAAFCAALASALLLLSLTVPPSAAEPPHTKTLIYEIVKESKTKSPRAVGLLPIYKSLLKSVKDVLTNPVGDLPTIINYRLQSVKDANAMARLDESGRIVVSVSVNDAKKLPDAVKNVEQVLAHLAGQLEFRILANDHDHKAQIELARKEPNQSKWYDSDGKLTAWFVPIKAGREQYIVSPEICIREKKKGEKTIQEVLVVSDPYDVTGEYLMRASPDFDRRMSSPCVAITFNEKGGWLFGKLTGDNLPDTTSPETSFRRRCGIILDGELYSAPCINSRVTDHVIITGNFNENDVENICKILNMGSLPVRLKKVAEK
jgi:preprotein translocase subunit SecD